MSTNLESIRLYVERSLAEGASKEQLAQEILSRKGKLAEVSRTLGSLSLEERRTTGAALNSLRSELEALLGNATQTNQAQATEIDWTLPALPSQLGSTHPVNDMINEMVTIFRDLSFEVVEGSEIVSDTDNFENLNITTDHPARDGQDSFYVTDDLLLRAQMTAVQVAEMRRRLKDGRLPIRVVAPGKTYRRESDQTHSAMFHQMDAFMVDTQTTFADLKGVLDYFVKRLFGDQVETRFRPHHFPFTEPSAELDVKLKHATGSGRHTDWLEIGGCGMIHPTVLKRAGLNPRVYRGWAFGLAIERPVMIRHHIPDLRLLFGNNPQFLSQFTT